MGTIYITFVGGSGLTLKATIERLADGYFREDDTETFDTGLAFSDKDITLTEGSSENAGTYTTTVTATNWSDGKYRIRIHNTAASNIAIGVVDINVRDGEEVVADNDLYHNDIGVVIDEANTQDEYTVRWFKNGKRVTSGITNPKLTVTDKDGTNLIDNEDMTQVGSTGIYKYIAETTERQTAGEQYTCSASATIGGSTRTYDKNLGRDSSA